jgi:hypothetical protein
MQLVLSCGSTLFPLCRNVVSSRQYPLYDGTQVLLWVLPLIAMGLVTK